jgi:dsRNA-specific ribonuclease
MSMRTLRLERWSGQLLSVTRTRTRTRTTAPCCLRQRQQCLTASNTRSFSASAGVRYPKAQDEFVDEDGEGYELLEDPPVDLGRPKQKYASPSPTEALHSSRLAALHARLGLPKKLPLQTVARTLVDPSADSNSDFNNAALAQLGGSIMSYHVSEWLLVTYPRLPMSVLFAAAYAYNGPKTLQLVAREWGVDSAAAPGGEVDPGYLQFEKMAPGTDYAAKKAAGGSTRPDAYSFFRRGMSSRVVYDDEFGDTIAKDDESNLPIPTENAYAGFVKALIGSIHLHAGREAAKTFVKEHILSRHLAIDTLFQFKLPVRELSRLCAREGFAHPVARILSETGRGSRHPVYVVGIYSGKDKLGEGSGASLQEARTRAAVMSLKSWYLYSPGKDSRVPSDMEAPGEKAEWEPVHIDMGEVIH